MELTAEQSQTLRGQPDAPQEFTDPATRRRYVLVAVEVFQSLQEEAADARQSRGWAKATQQGMALALGDEP